MVDENACSRGECEAGKTYGKNCVGGGMVDHAEESFYLQKKFFSN